MSEPSTITEPIKFICVLSRLVRTGTEWKRTAVESAQRAELNRPLRWKESKAKRNDSIPLTGTNKGVRGSGNVESNDFGWCANVWSTTQPLPFPSTGRAYPHERPGRTPQGRKPGSDMRTKRERRVYVNVNQQRRHHTAAETGVAMVDVLSRLETFEVNQRRA